MKVRTLVMDDEPLARAGLRAMLTAFEWVDVVGEAADGEAAVEAIDRLQPELVFLDVQMPGLLGTAMAVEAVKLLQDGEERRVDLAEAKLRGETLDSLITAEEMVVEDLQLGIADRKGAGLPAVLVALPEHDLVPLFR